MNMKRILFAAIVLSAPITGAGQAPSPTSPSGDAENGARLYVKYTCHYCHGTAGQGGVAGPRVALVARNLEAFVRYVRRPSGQMPAFTEKIVSDRDLTDIYAHLRRLPEAKPINDIPLLDAIR
jgi:mono/diheme cytochrome c family protein